MKLTLCPKCSVPLIKTETHKKLSFWCPVCGFYTEHYKNEGNNEQNAL